MDEREELLAEKARLQARLAQVEAQLRAQETVGMSWALLSSTGLVGRWDSSQPLPKTGPRTTHDVIVSAVLTAGEFGVITNKGRLFRFQVAELPAVLVGDTAPNLQGTRMAAEVFALESGERALAFTSLSADTYGWALGTRGGIVKRTNPDIPRGQDSWEIIHLVADDEVVGAVELPDEQCQLVFVTDAGQLLHYPAAAVRPQGRSGGGIVGISLEHSEVIFFGAAKLMDAVVVTNAGRESGREHEAAGSLKVTPLQAFPQKGRATGGVRCHRFLKGEDTLYLAWVGPEPAIGATKTGSPSNLPPIDPKRDGSGVKATLRLAAVGTRSF